MEAATSLIVLVALTVVLLLQQQRLLVAHVEQSVRRVNPVAGACGMARMKRIGAACWTCSRRFGAQ